jgi:hypothetical protein
VTILTEQLQQLEAVYMLAKQREYDPSLYSEREHAAATVIQKHLKRTLAVKKYKIRGKDTWMIDLLNLQYDLATMIVLEIYCNVLL